MEPTNLALLLVGLHSSGKTTLSKALVSTGRYAVFELGDGVREEAHRHNETSLIRIASKILSGQDPSQLAKLAVKRAYATPNKTPIFVGARTILERDFLRSFYPSLFVIGVDTPDSVRLERWKHRQLMTTDSWIDRERSESQWNTKQLALQSDLMVVGTDTPLEMCKTITAAIHQK